jgi:hypothetical protein
MSELRQVLELAIKALKNSTPRPREGDDDYAEQGFLEQFAALSVLQDELTKLKASLPDPVAWMVYTLDGSSVFVTDNPKDFTENHRALPLYTAPPKRKWQGLTDEEIWSDGSRMGLSEDGIRRFAREIEAKLKEKNA